MVVALKKKMLEIYNFTISSRQSAQFKWEEVILLGSYRGIDPKIQIGEEINSLSKCNLDLVHLFS